MLSGVENSEGHTSNYNDYFKDPCHALAPAERLLGFGPGQEVVHAWTLSRYRRRRMQNGGATAATGTEYKQRRWCGQRDVPLVLPLAGTTSCMESQSRTLGAESARLELHHRKRLRDGS